MQKLKFAKTLVKKASENIKKLMGENLEIETKSSDSDFVTNVDKETEIFLVNGIQKEYQNQDFLTEEDTTPRQKSEELWIIDPIDGTTNFIFQNKNFAISIAYYENNKPVFGIVHDVMADEMIVGISGKGAYVNDVPLEKTDQLHPLKNSILHHDLEILTLLNQDVGKLRNTIGTQRYLGSASLEISMVAQKQAHAYMVKNAKVWDVAASSIILEEVGGTYYFGNLDNQIYFTDESGIFIAAQNEKIMKDLKNILKLEE